MRYIFLLCLFFCFWACSNKHIDSEKQIVASLILEYDTLLVQVQTTNIESAKENLIKYNQAIEYSKNQLSTELKPSKESMNFMNNLKLMKRQFKNASSTKNRFISDVIRNQEQLNFLLKDIDNGIFETEDLDLILKREQQALQGLKTSHKEFEKMYKFNQIRFDSLLELTKTFNFK